MVWRMEDPQGNEAGKCKYDIVPYTRGVGLDLGCGPHKAFPHFIGMDSGKDTALFGIKMKPDVTLKTCERLEDDVHAESCDFVFSSHLLEHIVDHFAALREWWKVIKPGGHLVLYLPHKDLYPNIGQPGANPDHVHDFMPEDIIDAMRQVGFDWSLLVNETRSGGMEYSFLQVFRKEKPGCGHDYPYFTALKPGKKVCIVRYGGFGDMIQAANLLPELKRQGYHVTVMTTPKGADILKHDPHVDAFFLQDNDQVPNHELVEFWEAQAKHYDCFINLCESVEGTLLAMPGRANHAWPHAVRHKHLNQNYLEWTAELAEVPYQSETRFYSTPEEDAAALALLGRGEFNVMVVLSGSSQHKFYPRMDSVIAHLLLDVPEARVILSGDMACKILEAGWENEPRVISTSGEMGVRETLTLAKFADCVVGPETGVLNAVAFAPNAKVCLLSHSSVENLTKHWVNTASLLPDVPCYPCHRLHYGREYCFEDAESGAALCQLSIPSWQVIDSIARAYVAWKKERVNEPA